MDKVELVIGKLYEGFTIKEVLKSFYVGKAKIEEIRKSKQIFINSYPVNLEYNVKENDILSIGFSEKINCIPINKSIEILYEDEQIIIVNKPSRLLIHPDGSNKECLVNYIANYYLSKGINREIRYIHRIDFETSGIVVFAKDFLTFSLLNHQVETHEIVREYLALVTGVLKKDKDTINLPIGRDRHVSNKYRVSVGSKGAKESITHYEVVESFKNYSLIKCRLETGRTHQIRVHLSYLKHPLLGDTLYGGSKKYIDRVALHSYHVSLDNPIDGKHIDITCEIPNDFKKGR